VSDDEKEDYAIQKDDILIVAAKIVKNNLDLKNPYEK